MGNVRRSRCHTPMAFSPNYAVDERRPRSQSQPSQTAVIRRWYSRRCWHCFLSLRSRWSKMKYCKTLVSPPNPSLYLLNVFTKASVPGPGDSLPPGRSCLFGWDQPCPAEERAQGVLNLQLVLAPEPLSSPEGKRLAKTLNIRKLSEKVSISTPRGRYVAR